MAHIRLAPSVASEVEASIAFAAAKLEAAHARGTIHATVVNSALAARAAKRMARLILTAAPTRSTASDERGSRCANLGGSGYFRDRSSQWSSGLRCPGRPPERMDDS